MNCDWRKQRDFDDDFDDDFEGDCDWKKERDFDDDFGFVDLATHDFDGNLIDE